VLGAAVAKLYLGPHRLKQPALGFDIANLGNILKDDLILSQNGGGHTGKSGVLRSGDFDGAEKGIAAAYYKLVHPISLRAIPRAQKCRRIGLGTSALWNTPVRRSKGAQGT